MVEGESGMKKTKTSKTPKSSKRAPTGTKKPLKQVDLGAVREQITNLVGNGAVEMVETTIEEVGKGHYLAMKYLFEMVGLCPAIAPEGAAEEDSLAKTLLRRLQLPEEPIPDAGVTKECGTAAADAVDQVSDAVK
jgi:hypothetical protein